MAYAYSILHDIELARDVVQDTFIKLYEHDELQFQTGLKSWLYTVCRHRAIDRIRKDRRLIALDEEWSPLRIDESAPDPHEAAVQAETKQELSQLISRLPNNQREVIRLKFQADLSYKEISEITGYSVTNVGFILNTALKRLRGMMSSRENSEQIPRPTAVNLPPRTQSNPLTTPKP